MIHREDILSEVLEKILYLESTFSDIINKFVDNQINPSILFFSLIMGNESAVSSKHSKR